MGLSDLIEDADWAITRLIHGGPAFRTLMRQSPVLTTMTSNQAHQDSSEHVQIPHVIFASYFMHFPHINMCITLSSTITTLHNWNRSINSDWKNSVSVNPALKFMIMSGRSLAGLQQDPAVYSDSDLLRQQLWFNLNDWMIQSQSRGG